MPYHRRAPLWSETKALLVRTRRSGMEFSSVMLDVQYIPITMAVCVSGRELYLILHSHHAAVVPVRIYNTLSDARARYGEAGSQKIGVVMNLSWYRGRNTSCRRAPKTLPNRPYTPVQYVCDFFRLAEATKPMCCSHTTSGGRGLASWPGVGVCGPPC